MTSASETKDAYLKISGQKDQAVSTELVHILTQAMDNHFELSDSLDLRLHGNKRNDRNEIYRKKLTDSDAEILCLTLKENSYVTSLDLGYNCIGDDGGTLLGKLLEESTALMSLILSYNDIGSTGAYSIAKGIQHNETLKSLKLDGNKIGVNGGMAIASALQVNETLEELNINNTDQGVQSVIGFTTVLKSNSTLKKFDIGRPIINLPQEETTVHFAKMLQVNISLTDLHLSKHGIQNFGAERLTEHMVDNRTLLHLDLSSNRISRDGILCLARFLKNDPPLKMLNLGYNRAEDDGAIYLSDALANGNATLYTLVLCSNSLSDRGLCALAKSLYRNATLKQLYIWGNKFGTAASQDFLDLTSEKDDGPSRLHPENTDVRGYIVDGVPYLARVDSPY